MGVIEERQQEIIDLFSIYDDWMDKYQEIIDMGKDIKGLPEEHKTPDNIIKGCQSQVWLVSEQKEGRVLFSADSDAIITKGLVAMMVRVLSDAPAEEVVKADLHFIREIGLQEHLSPTRSNGLASMVTRMKKEALGLLSGS